MDAPNDERLLREFLQGQTSSFELLVRRYSQELFQFVHRFTNDSVAAEDVVQETFLQVHTAAATFDPRRRFKPWLFTIAANKARDYLRKRKRQREVALDNYSDEEGSGHGLSELLSVTERYPLDELERDEQRRLVRSVADELPVRLREVLILAYFHKFPYKDIAEILEAPVGTIKSRLHSAVVEFADRLRLKLEKNEHRDRQ